MLKLTKYIRKFWAPILFCVALLFGQSQAELSLPEYMSKIVSVGIQGGGFEGAVSDVYSEDTFNHLLLLMDEEEQQTLKNSYEFTENEDISSDLVDRFDNIKDTNIYVLKDIESEDLDNLEKMLVQPMLRVMAIDSLDTSTSEFKEEFGELPEGMTLYDVLAVLPEEQINEQFKEIDTRFSAMGESTENIAAGNAVKAEYIKLGANINKVQMDYIFDIGIKMLGIALLGTIAAIIVSLLSSRVGAGLARDLRESVFTKVESFSNSEFNKFSTASLITRTTNDITQVQQLMTMMLKIVAFAPMMGAGALIKAISNSPSMTWIIALVLVVMLCVIGVAFVVVLPKFKVIQRLVDRMNLIMRENLSGMLVIRAFGNEKHSEERFDKANQDVTKVNIFVNRAMSSIMPIMMFMFNVVTLLIIWFGAKQIDLGNLDIGQMLAFSQYAISVIMSFLMIAMISIMIPRASVAAERIYEVLSTEPQIIDPETPTAFRKSKRGLLEFKNVTFKYPGAQEPVLSNITFTAEPGKTTAFIGSTGSGKSTLINLIPRFYEVTEGAIYLNGVDIRDVKQHDLRQEIGLVPQKGLLFGGTIRSNIMYGIDEATDEQLEEVIRVSQAKEFIDDKEEGLDSPISQGGNNVSGGQKQRLAIARAIAKNPALFIFDDSFSALDFKTDAALRKELLEMSKKYNNTVLVVGQRIASIMSSDQIIVLDQGKIVGKGTHETLLKECEVYQEIAYSQLSKEELGHE